MTKVAAMKQPKTKASVVAIENEAALSHTDVDLKGLFQKIIVSRFKNNNVGIKYEMIQTANVLTFDSFVSLFSISENKEYMKFPSSGPGFKTKKASQQKAAEIAINQLTRMLDKNPIPNDQGESQDYYSSKTGVADGISTSTQLLLAGKANQLTCAKDWKGHLQTALLRKYKGSVEIKYSFGQNVRTDEFEATVLLTHTDPLIGCCRIQGAPASTKKASEKTAAEQASIMIDSDTLVFTPHSDKMVKLPASYSTGNESLSLRGLFGDNYTAPASTSTLEDLEKEDNNIESTEKVALNGKTAKGYNQKGNADSFRDFISQDPRKEVTEGSRDEFSKEFSAFIDRSPSPPKGSKHSSAPNSPQKPEKQIQRRNGHNGNDEDEENQELSATSSAFFPKPASWDRDFGLSVRPPPMKPLPPSQGSKGVQQHGSNYRDARNDHSQGRGISTGRGGRGMKSQNQSQGRGRGIGQGSGRGHREKFEEYHHPTKGGGVPVYDTNKPNPPQYVHNDHISTRGPPGPRGKPSYNMPPGSLNNQNYNDGGLDMDFNRNRGPKEGGKRVLVETKLTRSQQKGPHDDAMVKMLEEAKKGSPFRPSAKGQSEHPSRPTEDKINASKLSFPSPQGRFLDGHSNSHQALLDHDSDSKNNMMSLEEELSGGHSEKKAPDWKGELQTFLARNCKDFPFKIEYNSEERVAGGKFVARVTITFDNKEEENRVVYGIPAVNKKSTERTAAGFALDMFRGNELQIPHAEKEYVNSLGDDGNTRPWGSSGVALPVDKPEDEVEKVGAVDYKGRLQMLLARRYRGVLFNILYNAPKSDDGIFKAVLTILPSNVSDLTFQICEGRSSRVKRISQQSAAEVAVRNLELDTLEVPSAASDTYRKASQGLEHDVASEIDPSKDHHRLEKKKRSIEKAKAKKNQDLTGERADNCAYFMEDSCFLFVKGGSSIDIVGVSTQDTKDCMYRHRSRMDRTVPVLLSEPSTEWKDLFANSLMEKLYSQLEGFCVPNKENEFENEDEANAALDSFHLSISFGHSYFMNAEVRFEDNTTISLDDVENALNGSVKNRGTYQRLDYDPLFVKKRREKEKGKHRLEANDVRKAESSADKGDEFKDNNKCFNIEEDMVNEKLRVAESLRNFITGNLKDIGSGNVKETEVGAKEPLPIDSESSETAASAVIISSDIVLSIPSNGSETLGTLTSRRSGRGEVGRWISSGFRSSIFPYSIANEGDGIETFEGAVKWAKVLFRSLDYRMAPDSNIDDEWRAKIVVSTAYQVDVRLSGDLNILKVTERPLTVVHATLLAGNKPSNGHDSVCKESEVVEVVKGEEESLSSVTVDKVKQEPLHQHDVRMKVTTCKALKEGDALYQAACPLGLAPIEIDEASKKPIPSPRLKEGHRVVFARQMLSKRMFKHCYSVNVGESEEININTVAILSNCVHYEGEQLGEREPVIDLSLEVDLAPLITYLKERRIKGDEGGSRQGVDTFLRGVVDHIVALSNKIEES